MGFKYLEEPQRFCQKYFDFQGRVELEEFLKNAKKCKALGLDQKREIVIYLKRWGGWLEAPSEMEVWR